MDVSGKNIVITGGGSGIGEGMARRFAAEGAANIVVADLDGDNAQRVAEEVGGHAITCDVSAEANVVAMIAAANNHLGHIDMMVSNAGIAGGRGLDTPSELTQKMFDIHVNAHIWAAREVVPGMIERGGGYLLHTISAAGLISGPTPMPYVTTKHASFGFSEWCGIHLKPKGVGVSTLCPTMVITPGFAPPKPPPGVEPPKDLAPPMSVEECMDALMDGLAEERFIILPEPGVADMWAARGNDYDAWIGQMGAMFADTPPPGARS